MTMSLGWGLAVELLPGFVDTNLWPVTPGMDTNLKGLQDSVQVGAGPNVFIATAAVYGTGLDSYCRCRCYRHRGSGCRRHSESAAALRSAAAGAGSSRR
jgi:hypothetical protein